MQRDTRIEVALNKLDDVELEYACLLKSSDVFIKSSQVAQSLMCLVKAVEILPVKADAYGRIFVLLHRLPPTSSIPFVKNNLAIFANVPQLLIGFGAHILSSKIDTMGIDFFESCAKTFPANMPMWNNLGIAYKRAGRLKEAKDVFEKGVTANPKYSYFYSNLASIAREEKDKKSVAVYLQKAVIAEPNNIKNYIALLEALKELNELNAALAVANEGVKKFPNSYDVHLAQGNFFVSLKAYEKAIEPYLKAIAIDGTKTQAYNNIGVAYKECGENEKALENYNSVLSINPNDPAVHNNIGNLLRNMGETEKAIERLEKSIEINPNYADAYSNIGAIYKEQKKYPRALEFYEKALKIEPEHTNANFDISLIDLSENRYEDGWKRYEYRLKMPELIAKTYKYKTPIWNGEPLEGKTIILQNEQGFGDNIMFLRYAANFKALGAKVLVRTRNDLVELFGSMKDIERVYSEDDDIPPHDYYLPLLSSPYRFATTLETIPQNMPYLFANGKAEIAREGKALNIGIVWSSSKTKQDFKNKYVGLAAFKPLFDVKNTKWHSLQVGEDTSEIAALGLTNTIKEHTDMLSDFANTAKMIEALDFVITMDTAVAHLCGAMGKEAWVILPRPADWRWMQEGDSTPWYKSLKLFRQTKKGDWSAPIAEIKKELTKKAKN